MTGLFLEDWAKPLIVAHAVCAFSAAASAVHLAAHAWSVRGRKALPFRGRRFAVAMLVSLGLCLATGLAAYPNFRINVRALFLDHHAVWASNLFDIKENLGVIAAPIAVFVFGLERLSRRVRDAAADHAFAWSSAALSVVLVGSVLLGLIVTLVRGA